MFSFQGNRPLIANQIAKLSEFKKLKHFMTHPALAIRILVLWQWYRPLYYANLFIFFCFYIFINCYLLFYYKIPASNDDAQVIMALRTICLVFTAILILREIGQLIVSPKDYIKSSENYIEWSIIITSLYVVINQQCFSKENDYVCQVSSLVVVLGSSFELLLLLGRHPQFSTQIELFRRIALNYVQFWCYLCLLTGFVSAFSLMYRTCDPNVCGDFSNYFNAIFKTITMSVGEIDASNFFGQPFYILSHILIVTFVFFIVIVLMNLLNALAVDDTKKIRDDAHLNEYIARTKFIASIEKVLSFFEKKINRRINIMCLSNANWHYGTTIGDKIRFSSGNQKKLAEAIIKEADEIVVSKQNEGKPDLKSEIICILNDKLDQICQKNCEKIEALQQNIDKLCQVLLGDHSAPRQSL